MEPRPPLPIAGPPGDLDADVSERIRVILARHRIAQKDLAAASGVPESTLSRKLRNSAGPWQLVELHRVAQSLGVPLGALIDPRHQSTT